VDRTRNLGPARADRGAARNRWGNWALWLIAALLAWIVFFD
jgi:hypothetical protein